MRRKLLLAGLAVALLMLAALGACISLARATRDRLRSLAQPARAATPALNLERSAPR